MSDLDTIREDHAPRVFRNRKPGEPGYFAELDEYEGVALCESEDHRAVQALVRHEDCHTAQVLDALDDHRGEHIDAAADAGLMLKPEYDRVMADADRLAEALRVAVEYVTDTEYTAACQVADEQAREALRQHDGSDFARKTNRTQAATHAFCEDVCIADRHITVALTPDQVAEQERDPTTPTGKRLWDEAKGVRGASPANLIAIEHEAAAAERERLESGLADAMMAGGILPDDYYITDPDTPFGPEEQWFDGDAFAAALVAAIKDEPCCDCRIHVDGICKHHDRLEAPSE